MRVEQASSAEATGIMDEATGIGDKGTDGLFDHVSDEKDTDRAGPIAPCGH